MAGRKITAEDNSATYSLFDFESSDAPGADAGAEGRETASGTRAKRSLGALPVRPQAAAPANPGLRKARPARSRKAALKTAVKKKPEAKTKKSAQPQPSPTPQTQSQAPAKPASQPEAPQKAPTPPKPSKIIELEKSIKEEALELFQKGMSANEVGRALMLPPSTVREWEALYLDGKLTKFGQARIDADARDKAEPPLFAKK